MKNNRRITFVTPLMLIAMFFAMSTQIAAQSPQSDGQKARPRTTSSGQDKKKPVATDRLEPDDASRPATDVSDEMQANRQELLSEEAAAISPYYNNFFTNYRLGPEDVISVEVFNQPRYSRGNITVPPSGRISLVLIPAGVFVNGKTVEQVAEIIKKAYDEYIINPQVSVSLDKASSYRYSIVGDIGQPGVRLMTRRLTVTEAIAEAGGVLNTGDKSRVYVLRKGPGGVLAPIAVNISKIYQGKLPDNTYLVPGDQIVVPGNKLKTLDKIMRFTPILSFARIFGIPVPY